MSRRARILGLLASSALVGCTATDYSARAFWSDDDQEIAVVVTELTIEPDLPYEDEVHTSSGPWTLFTQRPDGGDRRLVARGGPRGGAMAFMRRAGYFVFLDEGGSWGRLDLDGSYTPLLAVGEGLGLLPSADGRIFARKHRIRQFTPPEAPSETYGEYAAVFLDAASGEQLGESPPLAFLDRSIESGNVGVSTMWHPSGELWMGNPRRAVAVTPAGEVREVPPPPCWYPSTSSSDISADGIRVQARMAGDEYVLDFVDTGEPGYPTRCFPE